MKRVFRVNVHRADYTHNYHHVEAKDDVVARERAVKLDDKLWIQAKDKAGVDYCEIEHVCNLD